MTCDTCGRPGGTGGVCPRCEFRRDVRAALSWARKAGREPGEVVSLARALAALDRGEDPAGFPPAFSDQISAVLRRWRGQGGRP